MAVFDVSAFVAQQTEEIKKALEGEQALVAVSGGVDSTVSALLTHKAVGDNVKSVFIDDNFMRLGEPDNVKAALSAEPLNLNVEIINDRQKYLQALQGKSDAEEKRKIFRDLFYKTLKQAAEERECKYLVQGTIKADIEETSQGIKTQHNVLSQIGINPVEKYGFKVIEPLKSLYKSQVREVASYLGVPQELTGRQPFPGPGLSIRVLGELTAEKLDELKKANFIVERAFEPHNPSQYFAAIFSGESRKELKAFQRDAANLIELGQANIQAGVLSEKATGIRAKKRVYGTVITVSFTDFSDKPVEINYDKLRHVRAYMEDNYPEATRLLYLVKAREEPGYTISMRAVKTRDFLEAESMRIPWPTLQDAASKILESCSNVSRVYYDVTPKPPATIEYE